MRRMLPVSHYERVPVGSRDRVIAVAFDGKGQRWSKTIGGLETAIAPAAGGGRRRKSKRRSKKSRKGRSRSKRVKEHCGRYSHTGPCESE